MLMVKIIFRFPFQVGVLPCLIQRTWIVLHWNNLAALEFFSQSNLKQKGQENEEDPIRGLHIMVY